MELGVIESMQTAQPFADGFIIPYNYKLEFEGIPNAV